MKRYGILFATAAALSLLAGCTPYHYNDGYYYGDGSRGSHSGGHYGGYRDGYRGPYNRPNGSGYSDYGRYRYDDRDYDRRH